MIERVHTDVATVPLRGRRVLRLALRYSQDGEPDALTFASGWPQDRPAGLEGAHDLTVPADAMEGILDALRALMGAADADDTP